MSVWRYYINVKEDFCISARKWLTPFSFFFGQHLEYGQYHCIQISSVHWVCHRVRLLWGQRPNLWISVATRMPEHLLCIQILKQNLAEISPMICQWIHLFSSYCFLSSVIVRRLLNYSFKTNIDVSGCIARTWHHHLHHVVHFMTLWFKFWGHMQNSACFLLCWLSCCKRRFFPWSMSDAV